MHQYLSYGNKQWLLQNIKQEVIWSNILGFKAEIDKLILNPLRNDKSLGSCSLQYSNGVINLRDFADKRTNGFDCISAYQYLNPTKSWTEICFDLLNIGKQKLVTSSYTILPGIKHKIRVDFTPFYREWTQQDIDWWGMREITLEQLLRDSTLVRPVSGYLQEKGEKKSEIHFAEQCYCYHCDGRYKFYFPNRKKYRFIGNMKRNDLWKIQGDSNLLITKAHKDALVLENCTDLTITHLQAEFTFPDDHILLDWELGFNEIFILLDSDEVGRQASVMLQEQFIYKKPILLFVEEYKDIDEFIVSEGLRETIDYLNYLINE